MQFVKMEGLGNDFIVLSDRATVSPREVKRWSDRRRGIGADGVIIASSDGTGEVRMDYWNADGGAAELCGNGLRCVARYAFDRGWASSEAFVVSSVVGRHHVEILDSGQVHAELGLVRVGGPLQIEGRDVHPTEVGNPHAVVFVDDTQVTDVARLGPQISMDEAFPDGTNVEFLSVEAADRLRLRVWERGVGETLACGTGAAAALAVAHQAGQAESAATVQLPGGTLTVEILDGVAWISGPARYVFEGTWEGD